MPKPYHVTDQLHKGDLTTWLKTWIAGLSPEKKRAAYAQLRGTISKAQIKVLEGK